MRRYIEGFRTADGAMGLDIGGTAGKIAFLQRDQSDTHVLSEERFGMSGRRHARLETNCPEMGGVLHFVKFETKRTAPGLQRIAELREGSFSGVTAGRQASRPVVRQGSRAPGELNIELPDGQRAVYATGGGAHRFEALIRDVLSLQLVRVDEFEALVEGLRLVFRALPQSLYSLSEGGAQEAAEFGADGYPCLVCNIGSGVSLLRVTAHAAERVGGTSIGGSTFLGLVYQMTSARTFDAAVALAQAGDASAVDLTVRDIYGQEGEVRLGIPGDLTACSFGKVVRRDDGPPPPAEADIAASVCMFVTQSIALYACTIARTQGLHTVFFVGGFLTGNPLAERRLAHFARVEYKRAGMAGRALFLRHAEYAGALGCLAARSGGDGADGVSPLLSRQELRSRQPTERQPTDSRQPTTDSRQPTTD